MSSNEPPASDMAGIAELQSKLDEMIQRFSVTQFESEDIVQLIKEGEPIDWIANQLKANSPEIDTAEITPLLFKIQQLAAPEQAAQPPKDEAEIAEPAAEEDLPLDLSQLDLSQIAAMLPPGKKLPSGVGMEQVKAFVNSPEGKMMTDFMLFCHEKGVTPSEDFMNDPRVEKLNQEWQTTPREAFGGKTPAELMKGDPAFMPQKIETYRRAEPRVGRNDPCPCGSGKKFKKCCGRAV